MVANFEITQDLNDETRTIDPEPEEEPVQKNQYQKSQNLRENQNQGTRRAREEPSI